MRITENCIVLTDNKNWMEQAGIDQLKGISGLKGVKRAVGMPDLHPGKTPVGIGVLTEGRFYPHLIGNDIGCGMGLFHTGIKIKKFRQSKIVSKLNYIRELSDLPTVNPYEEECPITDLGTIGSGNHFAEFQCVHEIINEQLFEQSGIDKHQVLLLIHSGSRGYGNQILRKFGESGGLEENSAEAEDYLKEHERALLWAERNRSLVAEKLLSYLGFQNRPEVILDVCHNYLERNSQGWMHRKGAVCARQDWVVIPGSRGSLTYLCAPKQGKEEYLETLSHGSGRKWARSICRSRLNKKYTRDTIRTTSLKSSVVCHDTNLLFAEAPESYKNIDDIIRVLKEHELVDVVAAFKPLVTYKG